MLYVTTTEPRPLFDAEEYTPLAKAPEGAEPFEMEECDPPMYWSGYLHGKAQDLAGFDVPAFLGGKLPATDGEFPCTLVLEGDHCEPCLLVQWVTGERELNFITGNGVEARKRTNVRGFIVSEFDLKAIEYARKCAIERRTIL